MRADVCICDRIGIDLASHHKGRAPDRVTFLSITGKERRNRLLCNASHHTHAPVYFCGVRFEFSHRGVIRLSRFRKPRIGQVYPPDIAELRRTSWTRQQHCRRPAGFYSKAERRSLRLHRILNVTGTVTTHPWPGEHFHCRSVLMADSSKSRFPVD